MPEQQEPESSASPGPAADRPAPGPTSVDPVTPQANLATTQAEAPQRIPYWLQQAERFLRVIVRIYLGLLVCLAPWYPPAWEANPLFLNSPGLVHFISLGAVRGLVSGLGLLNLWIALNDALRPLLEPAGPNRRP